jgi:hypothetical protein
MLKNIINFIKFNKLDEPYLDMLCNKKKFVYVNVIGQMLKINSKLASSKYELYINEAILEYKKEIRNTYIDGDTFKKEYAENNINLLKELYLIGNRYISNKLNIDISTEWNDAITEYLINFYVEFIKIKFNNNIYCIDNNIDLFLKNGLISMIKDCILNDIQSKYDNYIVFLEYSFENEDFQNLIYNKCANKILSKHNKEIDYKNKLIEKALENNLPQKIFKIFHKLHSIYKPLLNTTKYKIKEIPIDISTEYNSGIIVLDEKYYDKKTDKIVKLMGTDKSLINDNKDLYFTFNNNYKIKENVTNEYYPDDEYYNCTYYILFDKNDEILFEFTINYKGDSLFKELQRIENPNIKYFIDGNWIDDINSLYKNIIIDEQNQQLNYGKSLYEKQLNKFVDNSVTEFTNTFNNWYNKIKDDETFINKIFSEFVSDFGKLIYNDINDKMIAYLFITALNKGYLCAEYFINQLKYDKNEEIDYENTVQTIQAMIRLDSLMDNTNDEEFIDENVDDFFQKIIKQDSGSFEYLVGEEQKEEIINSSKYYMSIGLLYRFTELNIKYDYLPKETDVSMITKDDFPKLYNYIRK